MSLSTHVLDSGTGRPAAEVSIRLEAACDGGWTAVAEASTDDDGRVRDLGPITAGVYRITFDTGAYYAARAVATFYPEVSVVFEVTDPASHHHVPLLLSPFAYSTYRGS